MYRLGDGPIKENYADFGCPYREPYEPPERDPDDAHHDRVDEAILAGTYEVRKGGLVKEHGMNTDRCFPDQEKRRQMRAAGYKVYVDGKAYRS